MGQTRTVVSVAFVLAAFASPFIFTFGTSVALGFIAAGVSPWIPVAMGILLDTLYWSHGAYAYPLWSVLGAVASTVAFFVHRFIETSIMRT